MRYVIEIQEGNLQYPLYITKELDVTLSMNNARVYTSEVLAGIAAHDFGKVYPHFRKFLKPKLVL